MALLCAFVALFMVIGHTAAAQQTWKQVAPAGAGFRIEFPASPKTEWKDLPSEFGTTPTLVSLLSHDDGLDFLMMYSKFPAGSFARDPQVELEAVRNNNIQTVQGKLVREAALTVRGAPARPDISRFVESLTLVPL